MAFDGSSIEGFARIEESDMVAKPDPSTFAILPWEVQGGRACRMFCDIQSPSGAPIAADPRFILRRVLDRAKKLGFTCYCGCEMESFYFKSDQGAGVPRPTTATSTSRPPRSPNGCATTRSTRSRSSACKVEYSHHEVSQSQHEVDLRYTDALAMADNVVTYRFVARQVAQANNVHISFMPKPVFGVNGSGMHVHMSLFKGGSNLFFDARSPMNISDTARHYVAGLLRHASELTAVTNQWVNSYKRLVPGLRGAGLRVVGPDEPLGAGPRTRVRQEAAQLGARRVPLARPGLQPLPRVRRAHRRRPRRRDDRS